MKTDNWLNDKERAKKEWSTVVCYVFHFIVSSCYSWLAVEVIGAPDVYPKYGDREKTWCPYACCTPMEYIEVSWNYNSSMKHCVYKTVYMYRRIIILELSTVFIKPLIY